MMSINRRLRWAGLQFFGTALKVCITIYSLLSLTLLATAIGLWVGFESGSILATGTPVNTLFSYISLSIIILQFLGIGLLIFSACKCHNCVSGPVHRVIDAMGKMSRGDLGWKITLRKHDELSEMAASITKASCSLAERIGRLQTQARELTEVEDFILDAFEADRTKNPHILKGLRKLKITTSRLNSDIDSFQISSVTFPGKSARPTISRLPVRPEKSGWEKRQELIEAKEEKKEKKEKKEKETFVV